MSDIGIDFQTLGEAMKRILKLIMGHLIQTTVYIILFIGWVYIMALTNC